MQSLKNIFADQRIVPLVLLAAAFALFANTFGAEWSYDDYPVIVENPDVLSLGNFLADSYPGRPLREFTFLLDHALFGMNSAGWHLQQIFWHALCAWLVWLLAVRLDFGRSVAWIAALLFLVHPLQVEAVAQISHRKESLALAFCLLALLAYIRGCALEGGKRLGWLATAVVLTGVGYLGKQTAVAVLPLFVVYEWAFLPRERWCLLRLWKLLVGGVTAGTIGFAAWLAAGGGAERYLTGIKEVLPFKANYFDAMTFEVFARTVLKSWLFMAAKWPLPSGLAAEYIVEVPTGWFDPWVLGGLLLVAGYLAALVLLAVRRSSLLLPAAWVGLFFLPTSNVWPLAYLAADRYLYAPTVGVALLAAVGLVRLLSARPQAAWIAAGVLIVLLAGLTWRQNRVWATQESLWSHAAAVNPTSSFALNNVGNIHYLRGELAAAYDYYSRAVKANPLNPSAQYNMGMVFEKVGDLPRAFQFYRNFLLLEHPTWRKEREALKEQLWRKHRARFVDNEFVFEP